MASAGPSRPPSRPRRLARGRRQPRHLIGDIGGGAARSLGRFILVNLLVLAAGAVTARAAAPPVGAAVCPPRAAASPLVLPPHPPADALLACVGARPISGATFDHWARIAISGTTKRHLNAASPMRTKALVAEVMDFLIAADWLIGEAEVLGVRVSANAVRAQFDKLRRAAFPKAGELHAFLHSADETVADVLFRLRMNMLSAALQHHVVAQAKSAAEAQAALGTFLATFRVKWRAQTVCAARFAVPDCGRVQRSLRPLA